MPKLSPILDANGRRSFKSGSAPRKVRASYDAAGTSEDNRRHWAAADGLSADAANSAAVRDTLRRRSRYECSNNSYARGITLTLANDTIGTGPRLQMLSENAGANTRIEREFSKWAAKVRLAEKLRTLRVAKCQDGEAFCLLTSNPGLGDVTLDLMPIEADQIATPDLAFDATFAVDGIRFDQHWNPLEYHLLDAHPGDNGRMPSLVGRATAIPAQSMIHLFRADRPGQHRGVPEILPALPLFAQLRRFTLATVSAAETAANLAAVLESTSPANEDEPEVDPMDAIEFERNMLLTLPGGYKMNQVKAEHPSTTYAMFHEAILNEIARCLNMPYNIAAANSAGYNYSSGRLDHQTYFKSITVEQSYWEAAALDRIFAAWFDEAAMAGTLEGIQLDDLAHRWFWDGFGHVDPQKEATAQATRLASLTTTLADEYAKKGQDWETQIRQRGRELALIAEVIAGAAPTADNDDPESDPETDPAETDPQETEV